MLTELRPKKDLLDPKFSGYKLCLDTIPVYRQEVTEGVDHVSQNEDQYSFIHTKWFSLHNHLFSDPWYKNVVYYVDKTWTVFKAAVTSETNRVESLEVMWKIPDLNQRKSDHFNVSLAFPSAEIAVVSDGCGRLYVLHRTRNCQWKEVLQYGELVSETGSQLMTARLEADSTLHCVLMTLDTALPEETSGSSSNKPKPSNVTTVLHWVTFSKDNVGKWEVLCKRELQGAGSVDYVALEASCSALYIASNTNFKFTADSQNPVQPPQEKMECENSELNPLYCWEQTKDDLKVMVEVGSLVTKDSVDVKVCEREISVRCQQKSLVTGTLNDSVDPDLTTWTLEEGRLEILLSKREIGLMWPELMVGDKRGRQVIDPTIVQEVHSRLSHLCSDTEVRESGEGFAPTFNLDQLEECDSAPEDSCSLARLDSVTHSLSHQISLAGHQWLTSIITEPSSPPCICVRHDVDGCVWKLDPPPPPPATDWPCEQVGTFCALGYVAASKQHKKFILSAPDLSYAVICEASSHVFIYHKASAVNGELRNRKTSTKVNTVAKQQLINLESQSPVLGAYASNSHLFVLTSDTLYTFHVLAEVC